MKATELSESGEWQVAEIRAVVDELDKSKGVSHKEVSKWLKSWGTADERQPPEPRPTEPRP